MRATTQTRHLGGGAGFIDEDQLLRIKIGLSVEPVLPALGHVGPILLARVSAFFDSDVVAPEEAPHRAGSNAETVIPSKSFGEFDQGDIDLRFNCGVDDGTIGFDAM